MVSYKDAAQLFTTQYYGLGQGSGCGDSNGDGFGTYDEQDWVRQCFDVANNRTPSVGFGRGISHGNGDGGGQGTGRGRSSSGYDDGCGYSIHP